jgi:hypothetical protein
MIAFDHGAVRRSDETELAGMIAHGVIPPARSSRSANARLHVHEARAESLAP